MPNRFSRNELITSTKIEPLSLFQHNVSHFFVLQRDLNFIRQHLHNHAYLRNFTSPVPIPLLQSSASTCDISSLFPFISRHISLSTVDPIGPTLEAAEIGRDDRRTCPSASSPWCISDPDPCLAPANNICNSVIDRRRSGNRTGSVLGYPGLSGTSNP